MPLWPQVMAEIPSSVTRVCQGVNAAGHPVFGAISCSEIVQLCVFDSRDLHMKTCDDCPDACFLSLRKNGISKYLNHAKAEFARKWEEPYVRYSEDDLPSPLIKYEINKVDDTLIKLEANDGQNLGSFYGGDDGAGSDNTSSMGTSSAGSSDIDTDSDISDIILMMVSMK